MKHRDCNSTAGKKWISDKQYDVCYLLYDAGKWGGVKGTIVQANGLVDRGYRVCIVCRAPKPDWIDVRPDYLISANLTANDIPPSDIIVGTWYPTVPSGNSSPKGICVHYCRGYEAQDPRLSEEQKSRIQKVYRLPTIKIANSSHVAKFLTENFPGEVHIVRNDIDHSTFYPNRKRNWGEGTIRVLIVGPYEVTWKGIRDCLKACRIFCRMAGISVTVIRASQTPFQAEEKEVVQGIGCPYEYRFNLSEVEMAALYNECDILLSGSYPYVESFGRPAMEALACGLPVVLTNIPAYRDYDEKHDYALFVEPADVKGMADAMHKLVENADLRKQVIQRGIEVSNKYSIEQTVNELDRTLQEIYRKHIPRMDKMHAKRQYYGFSRPDVQAMVNLKARKILDVGCASGQLGAELKSRLGAEVWGVEIVEDVAQEAEARLDRVIHGSIEGTLRALPDGYFDTIIFADVLEHLIDPYSLLESIKGKLTLDGEIIVSIPNVRHWSVLKGLLEGRWDYQEAGILDRTHMRFFTRKSIIEMLTNAGFEMKEMKATTLPDTQVPRDVIKALSTAQLDVSTLEEEGNQYQYLVRGTPKRVLSGIVSIVILTFNQLQFTKQCVKSIQQHTPEPHEIIFVDNGSRDGTVKWLRKFTEEHPNTVLIENATNLGFPKGCNQGIRASSGEYLLLLNNDVVVTENWLAGMLECLNSAPDTGFIGPMTNSISGPQRVRDDSYRSIEDLDHYAQTFRETYRHRRFPLRRVVGFCMLFRRDLVEKIGLLDESFVSGNFEDDDFCLRAALEGYRNLIAGDVFIHHHGSRSFIGNRIDYRSAMGGNRKIFNEKWSGIGVRTPLGKKLLVLNAMEKADGLIQRDQLGEAIDSYLQAIAHAPNENKAYHVLAERLLEVKRFSEAVEALNEMPPDDGDLRRMELMGYCKEGLEQYREAEDFAERVLALNPASVSALNLKGMLAYKQDDTAAAEAFFNQAVDADPGYGEPYTNLGVLRWAAGRTDEGLQLLERGFILSPLVMDIAALYHSAVSAQTAFERAEKIFRDADALHPAHKRLKFLLIDILIQQGKYHAAMELVEDAMTAFVADDGMVAAALEIRNRIGTRRIDKAAKKATLSLCMIVKNEEEHLARCLASVKPLVDEMIVVDTGSTDRTVDIAKVFGAQVYNFEWTNHFADARNFSLSKASGNWILVMDADEVLSSSDHRAILSMVEKKNRQPIAYSFTTRNYVVNVAVKGWEANDGCYAMEEAGTGWHPSTKVRLIPNDKRIQFEGHVHELLEPSLKSLGIPVKDSSIPIHHYGNLNSEKHIAKGQEYYRLGKAKLESDTAGIQSLVELARQAGGLDEFEEAIELWQKVIELDSTHAEAFLNLGHAYMGLGRYEEALVAAQKTMTLAPALKEAALNYSLCVLAIGEPGKAIAALEKLLREVPEYPAAEGCLAVAYAITDEKARALEYLEKIRKQGFDCTEALSGHARRFMSVGRNDRALLLLELALESNYVNTDVLQLLAECHRMRESAGQSGRE